MKTKLTSLSPQSLMIQAVALKSQGNLQEAFHLIDKALEMYPKHGQLLALRGRLVLTANVDGLASSPYQSIGVGRSSRP